ncbi:hypothetical protein PHLGIDRAFT_128414 [Phlebiopsis gigantea 11061_1 CR5-6]|uniref:Uncharacterized protein n=1 Tax=Phlebiopsis gigantea (strain 11061_1 CR5-6) TaxID=745531 RepID=A0A0C3PJA5_PHLG1|nr:hypothetical protein PHLGIDRAFT_128414 [Phlebiopsis gigantea 11061_1 CR5-6]
MSIRRREPFKFGNDPDALDEQALVLDEQEQEEVIQNLKDKSEHHNTQYIILFQIVIGLSALLHVVFFFSPSKQSPLAAIFPTSGSESTPRKLPLTTYFTITHMLLHVDLSLHLLPPSNRVRSFIAGTTSNTIPGSYALLFSLLSVAPLVALFMRLSWVDIAWWSTALLLTWFIHGGQRWMRDEEEALQKLETLRYDAKGA